MFAARGIKLDFQKLNWNAEYLKRNAFIQDFESLGFQALMLSRIISHLLQRHFTKYLHPAQRSIMVKVTSAQSSSKDYNIHLFIDWDGSLTCHDTMSVLANIGYKKRRQLFDQGQRLPSIKSWESFVQAYLSDYDKHVSTYNPTRVDRKSVEQECAWLASLDAVEKASAQRVRDAGLFDCVSVYDVENAAKEAIQDRKVELREGWLELLCAPLRYPSGCTISSVEIISVNWSECFIRECLKAKVAERCVYDISVHNTANKFLDELPIFANQFIPKDPELETSQNIHTSADKRKILQQQRSSLSLSDSLADPEMSSLLVYIGDSVTDFDCLLEANIGIVIQDDPMSSSQSEMQETLRRTGVEIVPIAVGGYVHEALLRPKIYVARNLWEIVDFLA
jgi:hypothetical protein